MTAARYLLAATLSAAAGAGGTWMLAPGPPTHMPAALALGMPKDAALDTVRKSDPAAFIGQVCNGGIGVVAYIRHLDMEWMLMAHSFDGVVREIVLNRNAQADTVGWHACEQAFESRVLAHYIGRHENAAWSPRARGASDGARWMRASARLSDGTPLSTEARRSDRLIAQCTFDIAYGAPPPRTRTASGRPVPAIQKK